jgi:RES domain-containing protein
VVWRATIGTTDPLRSNTRGARWNPAGVEALYCSTSAKGAEAELRYLLGRQSIDVTRPIEVVRIKARLARVCRVVDVAALASVGVSLDALTETDWNLPQTIASAADWMGLPGLLVPSARLADPNLVILVNHLAPDDFFDIDA